MCGEDVKVHPLEEIYLVVCIFILILKATVKIHNLRFSKQAQEEEGHMQVRRMGGMDL